MSYFKERKKSVLFLCITLLVIVVSSLIASSVQSSGGSTQTIMLNAASNSGALYDGAGKETDTVIPGYVESGMLFIPKNATADTPAPGILLSHGYLNNYQLQLQNAIELSRRGFVVLLVDIEGHGGNNNVSNYAAGNEAWNDNNGLYDAVKYLYNLDCVDKAKIGASAHSMGAESLNVVLALDGEHYQEVVDANPDLTDNGKGLGLIKAMIWQGFDPVITNTATAEFNTLQGTVDFSLHSEDLALGILKASHDEFFYINNRPDGSVTTCPEYLESIHAAIFTRTGYKEGDNSSVKVKNGAYYVDGQEISLTEGEAVGSGFSVIFEDANEIHPLNHFSKQGAANIVRFFYAAFGTPNGAGFVTPTSETWWIKEFFSCVGLICFFLLLFPLTTLLLDIPYFSDLKLKDVTVIDAGLENLSGARKQLTYWISGIACALFAALTYTRYYSEGGVLFPTTPTFPQDTTNPLLFWAARVGIFTFYVILVAYIINTIIVRRKYGKDFAEHDRNPFKAFKIETGAMGFFKTLVLAILTVVLMYCVVFFIFSWLKVDFRVWSLDVKTFNVARMAPIFIRYAPLFFIYYGVNAFANSTYRLKNLPEWATIAINAVMNVAGVVGYIWYDYSRLMKTGSIPAGIHPLAAIVIFPLVVILPVVTITSRLLYKKTGNIWLGAFVNTLLVTIITTANTAASFAYVV